MAKDNSNLYRPGILTGEGTGAAPPEELKSKKVRRSGHLADQMLKYIYPKDNKGQLSIFDALLASTKDKITNNVVNVETQELIEGIKLPPSEQKAIDSLVKLLGQKSQTKDPKQKDYYTGNMPYDIVKYAGENTPAPKLAFSLYELTKEYKGGEYVAGKDIENVRSILRGLSDRRFLLSYVETTHKKDGSRIERKIEDFTPLIKILRLSEREYSKENIEISKKEESIILLNPIFIRQIGSKYISEPSDLTRRTIIAYGSHNLSTITLRLRDYLMRELSSKRYEPEITLDRLYYLLHDKWMGESRRKKVKQFTEKGLQTCKALGLLTGYKIETSKTTGEPKIIFELNKDWE